MFLLCIRSLHFLKDVSDLFFLIQFSCIYLSTFVTCHGMFFLCICIVYVRYIFLRDAVFFSHKQASLVYNRYMSWDGFPMFCIVYVRYTF